MKIVTFGEIMLRLTTPGFQRFVQSNQFDIHFGGSEANVAVSLANYGCDVYFVTKLPTHEIGQSAVNFLRQYGVHSEYIVGGGERVGIYFLETGASQRSSKVIYDRAGSAITTMQTGDLNWDRVFQEAKWFHWSGITPALARNLQNLLKDICKIAKKSGAKISCDLNFRKKLWTEKEAQKVMQPLMEYVDVCIANEEDAEKSLGIKVSGSDIYSGKLDEEAYFEVAQQLKAKYRFETVAVTLRESFSASRNGWSAILLDDKDCTKPYRSKRYDIQIVDRVGAGDAFAAGLIYGLLNEMNTCDALEFAVAASCLKQTIPGDFNLVSTEEVIKLIISSGSGRVER